MKTIALIVIALMIIACTCSATLIDLDAYILNTGSVYADPDVAFASRNETTGDYIAIVTFGKDSSAASIFLYEYANNTGLNASNFTKEEGFNPVKKPYPGYMKTNNTTDQVAYFGMVTDKLEIVVIVDSYQQAINVLKEIAIISRKDYQESKSKELVDSLN